MYEVLSGIVSEGKKLGRTLGFPTVNITCKSTSTLSGTYKVRILLEGKYYTGVGVYFQERELFEIHIFDYDDECYGKEIVFVPTVFLRENKKFDSLETLKEAISQDCKKAKEIETTVITFGTFDHFHQGHRYYLGSAKLYGDTLVTIIARDATVNSVKSLTPTHTENERMISVENSGLVDYVILGDKIDYYTCFKDRTPDIVCLGYDQRSFDNGIIDWYKKHGGEAPTIVRLEPYRESEFKSSYFR